MRHMRVLVAEDNADHLLLTTIALRSAADVDIEVIGARDGAEALDYLHRRGQYAGRPRPDLLLLDLSMPRVTGMEVLAEVKGHAVLSSLPVVVLTSSALPDDIQRAYSLGANSYVTKSGDMSGLIDYWCHIAELPLS